MGQRMIQNELVDDAKWVCGQHRLGLGMIYHGFVDRTKWVCGQHRLGLGMIYHDFVDEEEWVCGDTSRRCGHYEEGLWTRQGCFGGLSRVCL